MQIGIIGSGRIGGALGTAWAKAGHDIMFSSRHPEHLGAVVQEAGPHAQAGSIAEAAAFGEVILLAWPFWTIDDVLQVTDALAGKIVIDAMNPYKPDFSGISLPDTTSAGQELAKKAPAARIVKAFSTLPAVHLTRDANKPLGERMAVFYCGDDLAANAVVASLISESGFAPLYVGPLATAWLNEPHGPLYNQPLPEADAQRLLTTVLAQRESQS